MPSRIPAAIDRTDNRIVIAESFGLGDLHRLLAVIHAAIEKKGFCDLVLDFRKCTAAFPPPMVALCAQILKVQAAGIGTEIILPEKETLARLFRNANWAYFLDPQGQPSSTFQGYSQVPVTNFSNPIEQSSSVNSIVNVLLGAISGVSREDFAAIEWSLNELTDNVLTHAESDQGGLVQVSTYHKAARRVEFVVADAGVGIPATLRRGHSEINSDIEALERAIREGVTRDTSIGQGNGLFGSFEVCRVSEGYFGIHAGYANLNYQHENGLHVRKEAVPYNGTLVVAGINFARPGLLQEALRFNGRPHRPIDAIELLYEGPGDEAIFFRLASESTSFGSRPAGEPVRRKLLNLVEMCPGKKVHIDFAGVPLVSSSFADEVFAKLFVQLGPMQFMRTFEFDNVGETARLLVDRAIAQRAALRAREE